MPNLNDQIQAQLLVHNAIISDIITEYTHNLYDSINNILAEHGQYIPLEYFGNVLNMYEEISELFSNNDD